jgi:hypothetical protein
MSEDHGPNEPEPSEPAHTEPPRPAKIPPGRDRVVKRVAPDPDQLGEIAKELKSFLNRRDRGDA